VLDAEAEVLAGVEDGGVDDGGVDDGGVDDGGVDDGGADDGGADDGGADDEDLVGFGEAELVADLIGVGGMDVLKNRDRAGVRNTFGETEADGEAGDDVGEMAGGFADVAGAVADVPAPACGWAWLAAGVRSAPIRAKAATAEAATSPPLRQAEASDREIRCSPGRLGLAGRG